MPPHPLPAAQRIRLLGLAICYLLLVLVTATDMLSTMLELRAGAVERSAPALWLVGAVGWRGALLLKVALVAVVGVGLLVVRALRPKPDVVYLLMLAVGLAAGAYGVIVGNNLAVAWVLLHR